MAPLEIDATQILAGNSNGLAPVVFLTGGPSAGTTPYPALTLNLELAAQEQRLITWTQAALADSVLLLSLPGKSPPKTGRQS
jgi:hypothetical protein